MHTQIVKANREHFASVFKFCRILAETDAKVSFVDIKHEDDLNKWFEAPEIDIYIALDAQGGVVGALRTKRGLGTQSHEIYLSCAVHPDCRHASIATQLTQFGCDDQAKFGVKIARSLIYHWNTASIKTIEKCGFLCSGKVVMVHYDPITQQSVDDLMYYKIIG